MNAANEGCLGGGGVDAAISKAGAGQLLQDRLALPVVSTKQLRNGVEEIRCPTGNISLYQWLQNKLSTSVFSTETEMDTYILRVGLISTYYFFLSLT